MPAASGVGARQDIFQCGVYIYPQGVNLAVEINPGELISSGYRSCRDLILTDSGGDNFARVNTYKPFHLPQLKYRTLV